MSSRVSSPRSVRQAGSLLAQLEQALLNCVHGVWEEPFHHHEKVPSNAVWISDRGHFFLESADKGVQVERC